MNRLRGIMVLLLATNIFGFAGCEVGGDSNSNLASNSSDSGPETDSGSDPDNTDDDSDGHTDSVDSDSAISSKVTVIDDNGSELGLMLSGYALSLIILTADDFVVQLLWNGSHLESIAYYSSADCSGQPYYAGGQSVYKAVGVLINGSLYRSGQDVNGLATGIVASFSYNSYYFSTAGCVVISSSTPYAAPLVSATNSDLGLPGAVSGPLVLEYD